MSRARADLSTRGGGRRRVRVTTSPPADRELVFLEGTELMKSLREAVRSAFWIAVATLTLAGCAHTPSADRPLTGASEEPVGVTVPAAPTAAAPTATTPEAIVPPAA